MHGSKSWERSDEMTKSAPRPAINGTALAPVPLGGARIDLRAGLHRANRPGTGWVDDQGLTISDDETVNRLRKLSIPPAWRQVWASPDPTSRVQATGVDSRGRTQYRYADAATAFASNLKFSHMLAFAEALPALRAQVNADLRKRHETPAHLPASQVIATIVRLLELGLFRIGNERYTRDNHTYGLTTIRREHLTITGSELTFDFIGKEHLHRHVSVIDRDAARILRALLEQPGTADSELFIAGGSAPRSIHSTEVNAYLHGHTGAPATAKVFRTWGATAVAASVVGGAESPASGGRSPEANAIQAAASLLGNTPTVARASYVHPGAFAAGRSPVVTTAITAAAQQLGSRDVRKLFMLPAVQAAVLLALHETEGRL
jgi:DNA topoisomerase-1